MLLAAISDIHGNLPALEAVLQAIDDEGIHVILNAGDTLPGYPWPNEVIDLVRSRAMMTVQGELDRLTVRFARKKDAMAGRVHPDVLTALGWSHRALSSANLEFIRSLPKVCETTMEETPLYLCHGVGPRQGRSLMPDERLACFERLREEALAPVIICGRTHMPFSKQVGDTVILNPGSVGVPADDKPVARFALIDTDSQPAEVHLQEVAYDAGLIEERLEECGHPQSWLTLTQAMRPQTEPNS